MQGRVRVFACVECGTVRIEGYKSCGSCGSKDKSELEFQSLVPIADVLVKRLDPGDMEE